MAIAKKPKRDHSAAKDMLGDAAAKFIAGADASHEEARREDDKKIQTTLRFDRGLAPAHRRRRETPGYQPEFVDAVYAEPCT